MPTKDLEIKTNELAPHTEILAETRAANRRRQQQIERRQASAMRDVLGFLAILVGIAWMLILISYDPSDPSALSLTTSKHIPNNLLGIVGANVAAYSYQLFGFGGFLFPLALIYTGYLCIRPQMVADWFIQLAGGIWLSFVILTFLGSFPPVLIKEHAVSIGGFMGVECWTFCSGYLNPFGTYLMLLGAMISAILVLTRLTLAEIGQGLLIAYRFLVERAMLLRHFLLRRREAVAEEQVRNKIIQRELDKMERSQKRPKPTSSSRKELRKGGQGAEPDSEFPTQDFDKIFDEMAEDAGAETQTLTPPLASSEIKINPMKKASENLGQESFQFVKEMHDNWTFPGSYFFIKATEEHKIDETELVDKAKSLESKLAEFSVTGQMLEIHPGPVVTTFEFRPDAGIKYSRIVNLTDDLCLALGAESIRIDRMPGRSSIGMEVPNYKRELITFREMIESDTFRKHKANLLLCLGKTIDGSAFFTDLTNMPHLLIAGQTGSGKSVGINSMICSILMRNRPNEAKLIMIDPKMVEMGIYADIPHLLTPVVTDPQEAANALKWAVNEMERRYRVLAENNFRNLAQYNQEAQKQQAVAEIAPEDQLDYLPLIVVIIDELADLMMVARGEVEESIARLAQKSRAVGVHLILATQRPSVDIITGVIKSNLPCRLSYRVSQRNDSRIILDANGAERLLGKGDALFLGPGTSRLVRIHAPFLAETEVLELVKFLKSQGKPDYDHGILKSAADAFDNDEEGTPASHARNAQQDPMYDKAARLVVRSGQASVSYLQRKLGLGYARAAKLVDIMEADGIVGPNLGSKPRDILVPGDYFDQIDNRL